MSQLDQLGHWPTNTWFQNRRKLVIMAEGMGLETADLQRRLTNHAVSKKLPRPTRKKAPRGLGSAME